VYQAREERVALKVFNSSATAGPTVFLHIPKTAGSSLANMLQPHFSEAETLKCATPGVLRETPVEEAWRYRFIHGHVDWPELGVLPPDRQVVSLFREPVARALSLYWYWRSFSWAHAERTEDFGIQFAKSAGLEEFFFDAPPGIRANYENAVVRQLVGAPLRKPYSGFVVSDETALEIARRRVDQMAACGVVEDFEAASGEISRALGLPRLLSRRDNSLEGRRGSADYDPVTPEAPSPEVVRRLRELTRLDASIYRHVLMKGGKRRAVSGQGARQRL
jgi:hypothetical protein